MRGKTYMTALGLSKSLHLSLCFVLSVLLIATQGVAFACEGGGEVEVEGGTEVHFKLKSPELATVLLDVENEKAMFGVWKEGGAIGNFNISEKASCENKEFAPGFAVCKIKAELINAASKEATLKLPVEFLPSKAKKEVLIRLINDP